MFRPLITQLKEKENLPHPLKHTLKRDFLQKLNFVHNSINNPEYPKSKLKSVNQERCKFAVIGNRVTREYLECSHLVNVLFSYRHDVFDTPFIRALTALEWSMVSKELRVRYGGEAYCIHDRVAVIVNGQYLGGEKELKKYLETKFRYYVPIDHFSRGIDDFAKFINNYGRTCVYMHLTIEEEYIGSFIFMLYDDVVPLTCENFVRTCERKRGGYGGAPVHRIVEDGWIQCGGYGLKNDGMECENYIVPHDRRGVLCMANDGRHIDNSTQFFVLLQPAQWMASKYVAFGQLIDGDETLANIEKVPTRYEEPTKKIVIRRAGVLKMIAHDIPNKVEAYIEGHIEDLNALGRYLIDLLIGMVWLEIEFRRIAKMGQEKEIDEETVDYGEMGFEYHGYGKCHHGPTCQCVLSRLDQRELVSLEENDRHLENEESESSMDQKSDMICNLIESLPKKPYYIPLTDIQDPSDLDSNFDLKRFLQGYYCLESDVPSAKTKKIYTKSLSEKIILSNKHESESVAPVNTPSSGSLDTEENEAITQYFGKELDHLSFGGNVIRGVAKSSQRELIDVTPKRSSVDYYHRVSTLSSMGSFEWRFVPTKKKAVHIASDYIRNSSLSIRSTRRPTGFIHNVDLSSSDDLSPSDAVQTLLTKLYNNAESSEGPKLKDYVPLSTIIQKNAFLTRTTWRHVQTETSKEKFLRHSATIDRTSIKQLHTLNLQHGKKLTRKISSDYVKTMGTKNVQDSSIRSIHYARRRPSLTISEYRTKVAVEKEALPRISDIRAEINTLQSSSKITGRTTKKNNADIDEKLSLASTMYWQISGGNSFVESEEPHDSSLESQTFKDGNNLETSTGT